MKNQNTLKMLGWSLLYFLLSMACSCAGFLHPFLWVYSAILMALVGAWPYIRLTQSFPYFGMALLTGVITLTLNLILGEGDGQSMLIGIIIVSTAEFFRKSGGYQSERSIRGSYMIFSLLPFANTLRMWLTPNEAMAQTVEEMGESYATQMETVTSIGMLFASIVITLVLAWFASGWFYRNEKED